MHHSRKRQYQKEVRSTGNPSNRSGLIDCFNKEEFDAEYERLCNIWKTMPKRLEFIQYIDKYIKQYMKTNMLASVREMWL